MVAQLKHQNWLMRSYFVVAHFCLINGLACLHTVHTLVSSTYTDLCTFMVNILRDGGGVKAKAYRVRSIHPHRRQSNGRKGKRQVYFEYGKGREAWRAST